MSVLDSLLKLIRAPKPAAYGFLDSIENGVASGWAFDPNNVYARLLIELSIDGERVEAVPADRHRPDLEHAGLGDGRHAFQIPLPKHVQDWKRHTVEGKIAGAKRALNNSPMSVVLPTLPEPPSESPSRELASPGLVGGKIAPESVLNALSVVVVTKNRAGALERTLRAAFDKAAGMNVEFIVIDNGSSDETAGCLQALSNEFAVLRWRSVMKDTDAEARNVGVSMALNELILFLADDVEPANVDFFRQHLNAHRMLPATRVGVLGKIIWPNSEDERVNFLMAHVQGAGRQQFGFYNLVPYTWLDWRFFNSSNFSCKRSVLADWTAGGFAAGFESGALGDSEFAYRVNQGLEGGWRILYTPAAAVNHKQAYTVRQFIEGRVTAGMDARKLTRLHPEAAETLGTDRIDALLKSPARAAMGMLDDLTRMIEGAKSWAVVIENRYNLGSQNWHADLLSAVFEVSFLQGYVMAHDHAQANYEAAYQYVLERFQEKMANAASFEVFGRFPSFPLT